MPPEYLEEDVSAADVASYVRDVTEQLATMARTVGLESVAAPLEQARVAAHRVLQEKPAPDDTA